MNEVSESLRGFTDEGAVLVELGGVGVFVLGQTVALTSARKRLQLFRIAASRHRS